MQVVKTQHTPVLSMEQRGTGSVAGREMCRYTQQKCAVEKFLDRKDFIKRESKTQIKEK